MHCATLFRFTTIALLLGWGSLAEAQWQSEPDPESGEPLRVLIWETPPFAMKDAAGNWQGLSVDLWKDVTDRLNWSFEWQESNLQDALKKLQDDEADVAVAALTITAEREESIDFSHLYYVSGLSAGYIRKRHLGLLAPLTGLFSMEFIGTVLTLALVLLVAGAAVWVFERRANPDQFKKGWRGLGDGFWWSAVTMTTVGYGDKAPRTLGGRVVALIWMFTSLVIIAGFTAQMASALTASRLSEDPLWQRSFGDISVAVVRNSSGDQYATNHGARVLRFDDLDGALQAVEEERADVVVYDAPILRYRARTDTPWLAVGSRILMRDDYGFGIRPGSELREPINRALAALLHEPIWQRIRDRYLGESEG